MKLYSDALIPSKRDGIHVIGLPKALSRVYRYQKKHIPGTRNYLADRVIGMILGAISDYTFGPPNKRLSVAELDVSRVSFYCLFLFHLLLGIRKASVLPKKVIVDPYKKFLVWNRDVSIFQARHGKPGMVEVRYIDKTDRANKSFKITTAGWSDYPQSFLEAPFLGPFKACCVLDKIASKKVLETYFHKIDGFRRSRVLTQSKLLASLRETLRDSGANEIIAEHLPVDFPQKITKGHKDKAPVITFQIMRRQAFTIFSDLAENPNELMSMTHHKSSATCLRSYLGTTHGRETELRTEVTSRLSGYITNPSYDLISLLIFSVAARHLDSEATFPMPPLENEKEEKDSQPRARTEETTEAKESDYPFTPELSHLPSD